MTVEDKLIMTIRFLNNHYNTSEIVLIYLFSYFVCVLLSGCARGFSVVAKAFLGGQYISTTILHAVLMKIDFSLLLLNALS